MPIRNAPSTIPTTLRFMGSRLAQRFSRTGAPCVASSTFDEVRLATALNQLGDTVLRCDRFEIGARPGTWLDTGLELAAGQAVTLLAHGRLYLSKLFDVGFGPQVGLWYRIGEGAVEKIIGTADSFSAPRAGRLFLATKPPGEFADPSGAFEPPPARGGGFTVSGHFRIAVIQWRAESLAALTRAVAIDADLFGPALARLKQPVLPPAGWRYLWRLGRGEIFSNNEVERAAPELCCRTAGDVGILQHPVDVPLTPHTRLAWSWRVEQLPSRLPEHTQPTHDYLSIAVEFDNGLDLTYLWSAALPVDTIFQCPLPWWDQRETHWVVRSGSAELGRWLEERRALHADYRKAIGEDVPARIVAVWLIAVSVFQRGRGECRYRAITLEEGEVRTRVQV